MVVVPEVDEIEPEATIMVLVVADPGVSVVVVVAVVVADAGRWHTKRCITEQRRLVQSPTLLDTARTARQP